MIEDDLRDIIAGEIEGTPVYSRMIPMTLPECIVVQRIGGTPVYSGIRKARETVTVMAVSTSKALAEDLVRTAADIITKAMPTDTASGHYYTATALADGSLKKKSRNGPAYIEFIDMEVLASL